MAIRDTWLLVGALCFFLFVKAFWVAAPTYMMGGPRLGDDALTYLWGAKSNSLTCLSDEPALRSIASLYSYETRDHQTKPTRSNLIIVRTYGCEPSPYDMGLGHLLDHGVPPKLAFMIAELVVVAVLGLGIAALLSYLFGSPAAAVGLLLLTFLFLPVQGMQHLVPAVGALGLGLFLCREAARPIPNLYVVFIASLISVLIHPIGMCFVCIAIALRTGLAFLGFERHLFAETVKYVVVALFALGASWLWTRSIGGMPELGWRMGTIEPSRAMDNLKAYVAFHANAFWRQPLLMATILGMAFAGIWATVRRTGKSRGDAATLLLLLAIAGAVAAGLLYWVSGDPSTVSNRLTVALFILLAGFAGACATRYWNNLAFRIALLILLPVAVLSGTREYRLRFQDNTNGRHYVIDFDTLRSELGALPSNSKLEYLESEVALMAGLLAGGTRFETLPLGMAVGNPAMRSSIDSFKPDFFIALAPRSLNGMAALDSERFAKRFYGYDFQSFRTVNVNFAGGSSKVFAKLEGPDVPGLKIWAGSDSNKCDVPRTPFGEGWWRLDLAACPSVSSITIASDPVADAKLTGLSQSPPEVQKSWPWGAGGIRLSAKARSGSVAEVEFSWEALFRAQDPDIDPPDTKSLSLYSDRSGLVIIEANEAH